MKLRPSSPNPPTGQEDAVIVRTISPKKQTVLYNGPLLANAFWNSPWIDTLIDGHTAISVMVNSNVAFQSVRVVEADDIGLANSSLLPFTNGTSIQAVAVSTAGQLVANTPFVLTAVISSRYWKVIVNA